MTTANDLVRVSASLRYWQAYDASVKADLFSTAVETSDGILIVDPIPLRPEFLQQLLSARTIAGVFVTNVNHSRAAADFAEKCATPVFAHSATLATCELPSAREVANGQKFVANARAIEIQGAAAGEMAIYHDQDGGALIIGDALINFEPYGFTFLPPKYCSNAKEMRRSLRDLLDYNFERMLFAHGTPLMHSARKQLEKLLRSDNKPSHK
jgi:glyoxylase-like metal-dependent hydrolase (beta-lactamase superfamily II)